jgi:transcriptional regulator with XRE-family HTH domain
MTEEARTFGTYISETRKQRGLSQKQLAALIELSPQYLNDIEHDRRSPSSDQMIQQLAGVLKVSPNYLYYLAGRIPAVVRDANMPPNQVDAWVANLRRTNPPKRKG